MDKSNPSLTNVAFIGNSSKLNGGAMYLDESCPTLTNITFFDNDADEDGGGNLFNWCIYSGNTKFGFL